MPFILLLIAFVLIISKFIVTGDFLNKDISLKGGVSITIIQEEEINVEALEIALASKLQPNEVSVRALRGAGRQIGFLVESDIQELTQDKLDLLVSGISEHIGREITERDYSLESTGSALGGSFFTQILRALLIAFIFMGLVVFFYFRNLVPSIAVILAALSDIIVTLAIVNLLGIKIGTAGIAAFLMLIGYSIDTDIMLTTRVLKRKVPIREAITGAFKTGMTMTLTTLVAVTVALIFSQSEIIRQIMTILMIGLMVDIIYTWVQNSGLLLWYVEKNGKD